MNSLHHQLLGCRFLLLFVGSYFQTHGLLPFILPLLGYQKIGIVWIHVDLCGQNKTSAADVGLFLVKTNFG